MCFFITLEKERKFLRSITPNQLAKKFPYAKELFSHKYENPLARLMRPLYEFIDDVYHDRWDPKRGDSIID